MYRRRGRSDDEDLPVSKETLEWLNDITGGAFDPVKKAREQRELDEWVADITGQTFDPVKKAREERELNE